MLSTIPSVVLIWAGLSLIIVAGTYVRRVTGPTHN